MKMIIITIINMAKKGKRKKERGTRNKAAGRFDVDVRHVYIYLLYMLCLADLLSKTYMDGARE